jgi:hypothetical protein
MATIKNFEELEIWKMARELVNLIYSDLLECRDFGFKDHGYVIVMTAFDRRNRTQRLINSIGSFIKYLRSSK